MYMFEGVHLLSVAATDIPDSDLLWLPDYATQTAKSKNGILEQLGRMLVQDHHSEDDCVYIANLAIAALKNGKTSREIEKAIRNVRTANKKSAADPDNDWLYKQAKEAALERAIFDYVYAKGSYEAEMAQDALLKEAQVII